MQKNNNKKTVFSKGLLKKTLLTDNELLELPFKLTNSSKSIRTDVVMFSPLQPTLCNNIILEKPSTYFGMCPLNLGREKKNLAGDKLK